MDGPPKRPWWIRLLLSFGAGAGSAVLVAVVIAVVDLYLTGHGLTPLNAPLLDWPAGGVHLSLADILFLGAAVLAAAITWRRTAGRTR
jgi:hypothetical protein